MSCCNHNCNQGRNCTMLPKFLDQPHFHTRTPRVQHDPVAYADPIEPPTLRDYAAEVVYPIVGVLVFAAIGLILAWRG